MLNFHIVGRMDPPCRYCEEAKKLLTEYGIPYTLHNLATEDEYISFEASGYKTVPQVFINGQNLGGAKELKVALLEDPATLLRFMALPPRPFVPVKLLTPTAKLPTYGSEEAAGLDLYMDGAPGDELTLYPGKQVVVPTGVSVALPQGVYGRVAPRSGLAVKNGVVTLAGVIDRDYRGEIKVILANPTGDKPLTMRPGDRIAQLVLENYVRGTCIQMTELPSTDRGSSGFGSTGK